MTPDPRINSFLAALAMFTAVFFALAAWIPAGLVLRWLLVV
jgi:hypothetical protein